MRRTGIHLARGRCRPRALLACLLHASATSVLFVGMAMGSGFAFTWLDAVWNGSLRLMHAYFVLQATSAMVQARGDADPMSRHDARD